MPRKNWFNAESCSIVAIMTFSIALILFVGASPDKEWKWQANQSVAATQTPTPGNPGEIHEHSTFLIFVDGNMRRFDDQRFFEGSPHAHLHDYSFAEIHSHAPNVTLGFFFNTIGISFNESCIVFSDSESYCSNKTDTLKFFVDGKKNKDFGNHLTQDWEHYLISYGDNDEAEIQRQIKMVPDPLASPPPEGKEKEPLAAKEESL